MKILHLLNTDSFSGAENVVCQIASMMRQDDDIEIIYCSRDGAIRDALAERDIAFFPVEALSRSEVRRAISENAPDIIHAHDMRATYAASLVCGDIPLISHIHGNAPDAAYPSIRSIAYLRALRKVRHVFWVSTTALNSFVFRGAARKKSSVLHNVMDGEALKKKASEYEGEKYDIVYLGRLVREKNPERFVRIIGDLRDKMPEVKVAMIGSGALQDKVREEIERLGLSEQIKMLGFVENPYATLKNAGILLVTSIHEGMPMSAIEALSLGVPVISTPTDGLCELVRHGYNGYLAQTDAELVSHITKVLSSKAHLEELKKNAILSSVPYTDIEEYKASLLKEYRRCLYLGD